MNSSILACGVPVPDAADASSMNGVPSDERGTVTPPAVVATVSGGMINLSIDSLQVGSWAIRRQVTEADIEDMKASIETHGLHQPIMARPIPSGAFPRGSAATHEVVAGHVRFIAAQKARLTEVPCIVRDMTDQQAMEAAIIENIVRADLSLLDEAHAIAQYKALCKLSVRGMAARLGKGRGWVQERLDIVSLPQDLQDLLSRHPDTASHAREIQKVSDPTTRQALIGMVSDAAMSLVELRRRVKQIRDGADGSGAPETEASSACDSALANRDRGADIATSSAGEPSAQAQQGPRHVEQRTTSGSDDLRDVFSELQSTMRFMLGLRPPAERDVRKRLHQDLDELLNIVLHLMSNIEEYADES